MTAFQQCEDVAEIIVVAREDDIPVIYKSAEDYGITKFAGCAKGGATRQQSVINGLDKISKDTELIAIHDGARPLVKPEHIQMVIKDAYVFGGATLGVPVKDTIKVVDGGLITDTPPRSKLYITQTPQIFKLALLQDAYKLVKARGLAVTDEVSAVEAAGVQTRLVQVGANMKITLPGDLELAELIWKHRA